MNEKNIPCPIFSIKNAKWSCQRQILPKEQAMRTQDLRERIYERMAAKDTDELIAIWKENDHGLWSDFAFQVIKKLLLERRVALPNQEEMKVTEPPTSKFEIPWVIPFRTCLGFSLSWALFGSFLIWVFLLHPFYFFTRFDGPLWPNIFLRMAAYDLSGNIQVYGQFHVIIRLIEFGVMLFGISMGVFVLRKSQNAVVLVKAYLLQFLLLSIFLLLFFNVGPLAILYWEATNSIFNLELDWQRWVETINSHTHLRTNSQWGFLLETLKVYWLPISVSIVWYKFLIRSKWLARTFPPNPSIHNKSWIISLS